MEGIFLEFENENALRSYPFAEGCMPPDDPTASIPSGVFVDAAIYPVNPSGVVYLSGVSEDGIFSISDNTGVIMTGTADGAVIEFHDMSVFSRHVGTLIASSQEALSEFMSYGSDREYEAENTAFSASCVFPVVVDGVTSVSVGESGAVDGLAAFSNGPSDTVRVSSSIMEDGRDTLRFDIIPRPGAVGGRFIRRIICVVDGKTPFRIEKLAYNIIFLRLYGIDKEMVCAAAHREDEYEMADTCDCIPPPLPSDKILPETYQLEEVFIPPDEHGYEGGLPDGADNAFYLTVPNINGYHNPLSMTMEDGVAIPKTEEPEFASDLNVNEASRNAIIDSIASKGVILQVPGLSGGET